MGNSQEYSMPDALAKIIKPMPDGLIRLITLKQLNTQAYWVRPVITGAKDSACPCCGAIHPLAAHGVCSGCYDPTTKKGLFGPALLDHLARRAKCGKKIRPSGPKVISGEKEFAMEPSLAAVLMPMSQAEAEAATIAGLAKFWRRPLIKYNAKSACPCCGGVHRLKNSGICSGCNSDKVAKLNLTGLQLLEHLARRAEGGLKTTPSASEKTIKESISPAPESSPPAATPLAGAGQVESNDREMNPAVIAHAIRVAFCLDDRATLTEILSCFDRLADKKNSLASQLAEAMAKVEELTEEVASLNRLLAGVPSRESSVTIQGPRETCKSILGILGIGNGFALEMLNLSEDDDLEEYAAGLIRGAIADGVFGQPPITAKELTDQEIIAKWSALPAPNGYESLTAVLQDAINQAAHGKGLERHADDRPFHDQPIMRETQAVGLGFPAGQARKKILEAVHCCDDHPERAVADLLGAINYAAATVIAIRAMMVEQAA